jgi:tetratricopeptide (TPR) repeat protein
MLGLDKRTGYYRLLASIREFGRRQLRLVDEETVLRLRHLDWYAERAQRAGAEIIGPDENYWLDILEVEHDDLRAAQTCAISSGRADTALRMSTGLAHFWDTRSHYCEAREQIRAALLAGADATPALRSLALSCASRFAYVEGDFENARTYAEEALRLGTAAEDDRSMAHASIALGAVSTDLGHVPEARRHLEHALDLGVRSDSDTTLMKAGTMLAIVAKAEDRLDEAEQLFDDALTAAGKVGSPSAQAEILLLSSMVDSARRRFDEAQEKITQSARLCKSIGDRATGSFCLLLLGGIAKHRGQHRVAYDYMSEYDDVIRSLGSKVQVGGAKVARAAIALVVGEHDEARRLSEEVLAARDLAFHDEGPALTVLAQVNIAQGRLDEARALGERLIDRIDQLGTDNQRQDALCILGEIAHRSGDLDAARTSLEQARALGPWNSVDHTLAMVELTEGHIQRARQLLVDFVRERIDLGATVTLVLGLEGLAHVAISSGEDVRAAVLLGAAGAIREAIEYPVPPADRQTIDEITAVLQEKLGPRVYESTVQRGAAMTAQNAARYATATATASTTDV